MDSFFCVNPNIFPIFPFSPANSDFEDGKTTRLMGLIVQNNGKNVTVLVPIATNILKKYSSVSVESFVIEGYGNVSTSSIIGSQFFDNFIRIDTTISYSTIENTFARGIVANFKKLII